MQYLKFCSKEIYLEASSLASSSKDTTVTIAVRFSVAPVFAEVQHPSQAGLIPAVFSA